MQVLFNDLRLPDGSAGDILVTDGVIVEIGPGLGMQYVEVDRIDGRGMLPLSGGSTRLFACRG